MVLIEDGRIALDERIPLPRPRVHDAAFGAIEQRILSRVLQKPGREADTVSSWPDPSAHALRWAV